MQTEPGEGRPGRQMQIGYVAFLPAANIERDEDPGPVCGMSNRVQRRTIEREAEGGWRRPAQRFLCLAVSRRQAQRPRDDVCDPLARWRPRSVIAASWRRLRYPDGLSSAKSDFRKFPFSAVEALIGDPVSVWRPRGAVLIRAFLVQGHPSAVSHGSDPDR